MSVTIPVSWGELLDKISILQIKKERVDDPEKLVNIEHELNGLLQARRTVANRAEELEALSQELRLVNEALWDIEDEIRACERRRDFGARFVELARSVYRTNDRRAAIKYRINRLLGSEIVEEKSYEGY